MDVMGTLVKHISSVTFEDLPPEAVMAAKKAIADTIGVIIAGSSVKGCQLLTEYIKEQGGNKESTVAVFGVKAPAYLAAQANGSMGRALEIDDVYDVFPLHPDASVVPACLAIAERQGGINGKELITAVALGQDLMIRMALATKLSPIISGRDNLFRVFAIAGVAGKLLGLREEQLSDAMGIAYSQMVGDLQNLVDGAMAVYIQQGTVAKSGIESALMAQKGITGTRNVLQGPSGFYNVIEPDPNIDNLTSELGKVFKGGDLSIKLHTSCRCTHEAIDLALEMVGRGGIDPKSIKAVTIRVNMQTFNLVCQPLQRKYNPVTESDAKFSLPFTVAAAMLKGKVFVDEVDDNAVKDPNILALAKKITPILDKKLESELIPSLGSTIIELETEDGNKVLKRIDYPKGNFMNPVGMNDVIGKFRKSVIYSAVPFSSDQVHEMIQIFQELEELKDVAELARLLVPNA